MPIPISPELRKKTRRNGSFTALYGALLLLSFHWSTVLYINSSFLEQFVDQKIVSLLFVLSALCTIFVFLCAPAVLSRMGNVKLTVLLAVFEFLALIGMAYVQIPWLALFLFVLHQTVIPILMFNIDVFMEELTGTREESTGGRRGFILSLASLTGAVAALGGGKLLGAGVPDYTLAYATSAAILIPFLAIVLMQFRNFIDPAYARYRLRESLDNFWKFSDIRNVFLAHFLLQMFFAWMVIYTPIYLATELGFNWEQIGTIIFAGLMAYVFLEYLIGIVADKYIGEKEMMAVGFAVIGISTSWFIFLDGASILAWMGAMFMTRVGASFVEVTTESYFFKHTRGRDANLIGLFRITRPLSYVFGAVLGSMTLSFLPYELLFPVLGLLMMPGLFFAMGLHDTK
jgi:MFS family permease